MEVWFKYYDGFVNIDDEYVYFTNSGNWTDAKSQKSYSSISTARKIVNVKAIVFYIVLGVIVLLAIYSFLKSKEATFVGFIISLAFGIMKFRNLHGMYANKTFKVPIEDINHIAIENDSAQIRFTYKPNKSYIKQLFDLNSKAIGILNELSDIVQSKKLYN